MSLVISAPAARRVSVELKSMVLGQLTLDADSSKLGRPIARSLGAERFGRREVDGFAVRSSIKQPNDGKLKNDGLARAGRRRDDHVLVGVYCLPRRSEDELEDWCC